jgi:hypothetical protein
MGQLRRQLVMWGAIATTTAVLPGLALADLASPEHGGRRYGRGDRDRDAKLSVAGRAISKGTTDSYGLQIRGSSGDQPTDAGGMVRFAHRGENMTEGLVGEISCLSKDSAGIVSVTGTIHRSGKRDKAEKGDQGEKGEKGEKGNEGDKKKEPGAPSVPGAPSAPNVPVPTAGDDGTALLDELAPWDEDEAAELAEPVRHGRDGKGRRGERRRQGGGELAGKDFALTISVAGKPQKFSQPTIGEKGTLTACSGGGAPTAEVTRGGFRTREAGAKSDGESDRKGDREGRKGRRGWFR